MAQTYAGFVCFLAWASGSISHPPAKRAVALAFINMVSSFGNVFGSYIWPPSWGQSYAKSCSICLVANALGIIMCWAFKRHLDSLNKNADREERESGASKGYRYML